MSPLFPHAGLPAGGLWLFDLQRDPNERQNLAASHPAVVRRLRARLAELADPARGYRHPQPNLPSLRSLPALHNGTWAPFRMLGKEEEEAHPLEAYVEAEALSAPFWD